MSTKALETRLAEICDSYRHDPLGWVNWAFPWGEEGDLVNSAGPRAWQVKVLDELGRSLRSGECGMSGMAFKKAVRSGRGVGKSALVCMLVLWAMSTVRNTKCRITASTEQQLRTTTWPELSKWHRLCITGHWFRHTGTALLADDPKAEKTWRADAVTWSETNTVSFQGLHNEGSRILVIFDEASGIHDEVWNVTEGSMARDNTEIMWFAFGNPNYNTGRFIQCWGKYRNFWRGEVISSWDVEGTNIKQLEEWELTETEDWNRVHVKGLPPVGEGGNLIAMKDVEAAMENELPERSYKFMPVVIGVDPAWSGDDTLEVVARQGQKAWRLFSMLKNDDDVGVANRVAEHFEDLEAEMIFVDQGWGTGIYSALKSIVGKDHVRIISFGSKSMDPECVNKRAEMWKSLRDWIKNGADIPKDENLKVDLTSVSRKAQNDGRILLKSKDEMKTDGLASPNIGDALALTFAMPVIGKIARRPKGVAMIPSVNKMA